ncbi:MULTISPECIES: molybdopterin-synthase adenylyltransferase MoeB [unclassified Pseudomonas]|uniref:molybdopterin-synthase adenylyltransferase MoeB n=1 Tax=unclassified Pseudomonas TaxID=196821 RepID=UPI00159FA282|nr:MULTISPECIES: molybdopterin-synthase adenylyltransferase MoeB [unclassified Pseudomonas]NWC90710.1 molybdopterin-synthase adenylyltransferase MoeB [Pseudomonas sp. IPO3779]NWD20784.1 molybdopterin-synthase adenylyltransferase MoeB [Pseudomonas sp. IPO3778]
MKVLSPTALEQIYAHADRSYPEECCGFVFADGSVYLGSNIQNELHRKNPEMYSRSAANGYTFSVADTLKMNKAFRSDNPVVVIYHSHPDVGAYFSDEDQDKALFMGEPIYPVSYLVVDVRQGKTQGSKLFAWDGNGFAQKPFNDLQTELCMNAVSFPDILVRVAKLPAPTLEGAGSTLREVIENLCAEHPQLRAHLLYENNQLKEHFLFTAEEELIDANDPLPEKAKIEVLLATSGGMDVDSLSNEEVQRYVRHITLPGVGREGQLNLKKAKVLIIGTGGLGSPISLYLAAAGIGTLGLVDFDVVESSNLQRQIVHGNSTLGMPKVESAKQRLQDLNSHIQINTYDTAFNTDNALELVGAYDLVIDGTDNFETRYLVNDACVQLGKPLVYGAIYRFDGQISVLNYKGGPCYRCLFPQAPPAELAPNCSAGGVIGVLPGVVGMIQATEAIKLLIGIGEPLSGRLMRFDALAMKFSEIRFKRRAECPCCSELRHTQTIAPAVCADAVPSTPSLAEERYIKPRVLKQLLEQHSKADVLLDVRDASELEVCKLPGVVHIPLAELDGQLATLSRDNTHYLICYAGTRAEQAATTLLAAGFANTKVLQGGMKHWVRDVEPDMPLY